MGGGAGVLHVLLFAPVIKNMHIGLFGDSISSRRLAQWPYFKMNAVKIVDKFRFVLLRLWILAQKLHDGVLSVSSILKSRQAKLERRQCS